MDPNPIIVQIAIAAPITFGLALYTLLRWDRTPLHAMLAGMLFTAAVWLAAMGVKLVAEPEWIRALALDFEFATIAYMAPFFLMTMGYFARSASFEHSSATGFSLLAVSTIFFVAFLTDPQHQLFFTDREAALAGAHPMEWGGPIYWALQLWCIVCDLLALGFCVSVLRRGRNSAEKGRAMMVLAAVATPVLAHFLHVLEILPVDYSLAPGALGLTAFFFVQGVHRYGLLEGQPLVRHDLIEHLEDGLVLADPDGVVLDANAAAERILRCEREALRGRSLLDALDLLDAGDKITALAGRIVSLPLDGARIGGEIRTDDGRWMEIAGGAVAALGSLPAGRFVSIRDRTHQRRSDQLLRERQKLESVGVLAAGVAHEVNNPLAYVRSNLVHLHTLTAGIEKHLSPELQGEAAELIELPDILGESLEGLDRISQIVESLLRFSRVPDEQHLPVDPAEVTREALRLAALERDSNVHVACDLPASLPSVSGSPQRLVQVLLNLILNAKHAVADQTDGRITAEAGLDGESVQIRVRDNGPGIPEELRPRIFDPFFTTRPPDQGTGLGLSIAFDIVRDHGGTLELESQVGEDTCFTVRLPAGASS